MGASTPGARGPRAWVRADVHPGRLLPTVSSAVVIGVVEVVLATSFAALIFSGPLTEYLPLGIGLALFSGILMLALIAVLATQPGTVGSIQDNSAVILGLAAVSVAQRVPAGDERFLTVVLVLGLASLVTGGTFLLLGSLRLGNLVRFVPYPVVGGFLAGTGWLLVKGGAGVLTGVPFTLSTLGRYAEGDVVAKWVPGLAFAVVLLLGTRRYRQFLLIPASIMAAIALFYVVVVASGASAGEAESGGWLLGPFPGGGLWEPHLVSAVVEADWAAVLSQAANVATVVIVAALALLLNSSGIELTMNREIDVNRDLRAAGLANLASGAGGGLPGYQALSLTALSHRTGASGRMVGVLAAAVCLAVMLFGASLLSLFPRAVLGGVIAFLGLGFLAEWILDAWPRLHRAEYAVVILILLVIGTFGFIQGVAVGLVMAVGQFVVSYSRTDVVRHTLSGLTYQSNVERAAPERERLRAHGEEMHVLDLQGFIFFGTARTLLDRIRARVADPERPPLRFLVLDFRRVSGVDSSAILNFGIARKLAESQGFRMVFTSPVRTVWRQLERGGLREDEIVRVFADLDHGVQWCEDQILEADGAESPVEHRPLADQLEGMFGERVDLDRLMPYLHRMELSDGEYLIRQGDRAEELYFLESGRVTAVLETEGRAPMRLRSMGPGTVVGELPLYLGTPRAASVVGDGPSTLYRLTLDDFREMERQDPELAALLHRLFARLMAQRLADTLQTLQALQD
jgi:sulfate permease, SulP family